MEWWSKIVEQNVMGGITRDNKIKGQSNVGLILRELLHLEFYKGIKVIFQEICQRLTLGQMDSSQGIIANRTSKGKHAKYFVREQNRFRGYCLFISH